MTSVIKIINKQIKKFTSKYNKFLKKINNVICILNSCEIYEENDFLKMIINQDHY